MSEKRGWYENEVEYAKRIRREGNLERIKAIKGVAPERTPFETRDEFDERVEFEARQAIVEQATGERLIWTPILESHEEFREDLSKAAVREVVRADIGYVPDRELFETPAEYEGRLRDAEDLADIRAATGAYPERLPLETSSQFRSRIRQEAREARTKEKLPSQKNQESEKEPQKLKKKRSRKAPNLKSKRYGSGIGISGPQGGQFYMLAYVAFSLFYAVRMQLSPGVIDPVYLDSAPEKLLALAIAPGVVIGAIMILTLAMGWLIILIVIAIIGFLFSLLS